MNYFVFFYKKGKKLIKGNSITAIPIAATTRNKSFNTPINGPCYVIYSDCQPNSTRFKVLFGIPHHLQIDKPYAKFKYYGNLLDIGDIFKTDYARFSKISKQETENSHIELIQVFDNIHNPDAAYHIYTPIKKLPIDFEF